MAISIQDVMGAYSPVMEAFDMQKGQSQLADRGEMNANVNFDNRIQQQALPISRMLNIDGTLNKDAIKGAGAFSDPHDMWNDIQAQMPKGRSIDPVVFQEKYQMGKQMFDMNLANQVAQMGEAGMSAKKRRAALKENPDLYDYALQNNILPREDPASWTWGDTARTVGIIGAGVGGEALYRALSRGKIAPSTIKDLRSKGLKVVKENGKNVIKRMSPGEIYEKPKVKSPADMNDAIKKAKDKVKSTQSARKSVIKDNKILGKAVGGNKGATRKVLEKGMKAKPSALIGILSKTGKFLKGRGAKGAAVGLGVSALAEYLINQQE